MSHDDVPLLEGRHAAGELEGALQKA